jgi:nitroreductase
VELGAKLGLRNDETRVLTLSVPNPGAWNTRPSLVLHRTRFQRLRNQLLTLFRGTQQAPDPLGVELLQTTQGYKLTSLIPIAYPAESQEKSKRPLSDVLHWEKY